MTFDSNRLTTGQSVLVADAGNITSLVIDEKFGRLFWSVIYSKEDKFIGSIFSVSIEGYIFFIKFTKKIFYFI